MKYNKNDLEQLILIEKKSYIEISKMYGVSDTYIKKISKKLGINLPIRAKFPKEFTPHNKGVYKLTKCKSVICKNCGNTILILKWSKQQYCDKNCFGEHKSKKTLDYYLSHQDEYYGKYKEINFIKKYLLVEQNCKCKICEINNTWNNKPIVFVLDHIDGDANNNRIENLRLICSNCDSQLPTYKSKNKNSARKERYLLNYKK